MEDGRWQFVELCERVDLKKDLHAKQDQLRKQAENVEREKQKKAKPMPAGYDDRGDRPSKDKDGVIIKNMGRGGGGGGGGGWGVSHHNSNDCDEADGDDERGGEQGFYDEDDYVYDQDVEMDEDDELNAIHAMLYDEADEAERTGFGNIYEVHGEDEDDDFYPARGHEDDDTYGDWSTMEDRFTEKTSRYAEGNTPDVCMRLIRARCCCHLKSRNRSSSEAWGSSKVDCAGTGGVSLPPCLVFNEDQKELHFLCQRVGESAGVLEYLQPYGTMVAKLQTAQTEQTKLLGSYWRAASTMPCSCP